MPKINNLELPAVTLSGGDPDHVSAKLADMPMPLEAMIEVCVYLRREIAKVEALAEIDKMLAGRIKATLDSLPANKRETRRTEVGMAVYSEAGEKVEIKDRDTLVESLTPEQLRISYVPDLKALETILKKDVFERFVKRSPTSSKVSIRDLKSNEFTEVEF